MDVNQNYAPPAKRRPPLARAMPLVLMLLIGFLLARWVGNPRQRLGLDPDAQPLPVVARGDLASDEQTTIELFRKNSASVVFITTTKVNLFSFDETTLSQGNGSGFVWNNDGHIVTNYHVIEGANAASVTLSDQSVWDAKVVGRIPSKDLAVLKIDAPAEILHPIQIGQSNNLQVGQKVFAIGNPFGLDHTLTTGVISSLDREIPTTEQSETFSTRRMINGVIQTDAAINPGNSGGPLLDSAGLLIGVNTAIYSPSGAFAGVGFAIPVDTVNRFVPELIRYGRVIRPDVGIIPFRDQFARQLKLKGVLIRRVYENSPAHQSGLRPTTAYTFRRSGRIYYSIRYGDLIVAGDDTKIENLDDWFSYLEKHRVGDRVKLTILRDLPSRRATQMEVEITLAAAAGS